MDNLEKRMYSLVMYQLSGIQAGIQSGHSNIEYSNEYGEDPEYKDWATKWRTVIVLNGGTSNTGKESYYGYPASKGTMEKYYDTLKDANIKVVPFYEPDMNYCMTSMSFLVDERVFNKELYPDPELEMSTWLKIIRLKTFDEIINYDFTPNEKNIFDNWIESIGGKSNLFLRFFVTNFRLATN